MRMLQKLRNRLHKEESQLHQCTLVQTESPSGFEFSKEKPRLKQRVFYFLKRITVISESNPQSIEYFRSRAEILRIKRQHIQSKSWIIHPFSDFRTFYEMWMVLIWFITILYIPAEAAFELSVVSHRLLERGYKNLPVHTNAFTLSLQLLGLIDIVLTFWTGYLVERRRKVVMKPMKIIRRYIVSVYFISDVICSLPINLLVKTHTKQRLINIVGFLRIVHLRTLYLYISRTFSFWNLRHIAFGIIKYVIVHYLIFHWFACWGFMVPQIRFLLYGELLPESWVERLDFNEQNLTGRYVMCMYRTIGNLFCILFEQRQVVVWEERLMTIIMFIFGKVYIFYIVVMILTYLLRHRSLETTYYETISQVQAYMTQKQLSLSTQTRLLQFYDYKFNKKFFKEHNITGLLSEKLRGEMNLNVCSKLVQNVTLLGHLSKPQLEQVVLNLRSEIYLANDIIIKAGSVGDCMYFLASGTVSVWTPSGKEVCHLQDGAYFGEISLVFKDKRRTANIVAIEICEVYKLDRRSFRNIFKASPDLLKMLEEVATARMHVTQMFEEEHAKTFMELSTHHA